VAEVEVSAFDGPGSPPLLAMIGEFHASNCDLVEDFLTLWLAQGRPSAVLDMSRTSFIDSTVISALVAAQEAGLALTVRGVTGQVRTALDEARGGEVLKVETVPP